MALEMTAEQEQALANLLLSCGSTRGCEAGDAERVWSYVRDAVVDAMAKSFDVGGSNDTSHDDAWWFVDKIREFGSPQGEG